MKTYIVLLRYTEKGIESLKKYLPGRDEMDALCRSCGASLKEFQWLAGGSFDSVLVCEAPDTKTLTGLLDKLDGCGTEALSVVSESQFRAVIEDQPMPKELRYSAGKALR